MAVSDYCAMFSTLQGIKYRAIFSLRRPLADWRPECPISGMRQQVPAEIRRYDYEM